MRLFSFRKLFWNLFLLFSVVVFFFVLLFRNCKREEAGGEAEGKMHGLQSMIMFTNIQLRIILKLPVNPNIKRLKKFNLYGGLEAQAKPKAS